MWPSPKWRCPISWAAVEIARDRLGPFAHTPEPDWVLSTSSSPPNRSVSGENVFPEGITDPSEVMPSPHWVGIPYRQTLPPPRNTKMTMSNFPSETRASGPFVYRSKMAGSVSGIPSRFELTCLRTSWESLTPPFVNGPLFAMYQPGSSMGT